MNIYISWTIKSISVVDEVRSTLWTCAITSVKIAKKQDFGAKTSGEKQSFELFVAANGQRDNALLALPHWRKSQKTLLRDCVAQVMWPPTDQRARGLRYGWKRGNIVLSLLVSTSHWRPRPHITVLFLSQMLFQKLSRKLPLIKFLNDLDHFFNQQFDIFYFLFPVSDHLAWSPMSVRKPFLECHKSSVSSVFDSADQTCWKLTYKKEGCITICR